MAINEINKPDDAAYRIYGKYFKVGVHGTCFYWNGFEWISSTLTIKNIEEELNFWKNHKEKECYILEQRPIRSTEKAKKND